MSPVCFCISMMCCAALAMVCIIICGLLGIPPIPSKIFIPISAIPGIIICSIRLKDPTYGLRFLGHTVQLWLLWVQNKPSKEITRTGVHIANRILYYIGQTGHFLLAVGMIGYMFLHLTKYRNTPEGMQMLLLFFYLLGGLPAIYHLGQRLLNWESANQKRSNALWFFGSAASIVIIVELLTFICFAGDITGSLNTIP